MVAPQDLTWMISIVDESLCKNLVVEGSVRVRQDTTKMLCIVEPNNCMKWIQADTMVGVLSFSHGLSMVGLQRTSSMCTGKHPLKYSSAMAGNWTRAMRRSDSEIHLFSHWAIMTDLLVYYPALSQYKIVPGLDSVMNPTVYFLQPHSWSDQFNYHSCVRWSRGSGNATEGSNYRGRRSTGWPMK